MDINIRVFRGKQQVARYHAYHVGERVRIGRSHFNEIELDTLSDSTLALIHLSASGPELIRYGKEIVRLEGHAVGTGKGQPLPRCCEIQFAEYRVEVTPVLDVPKVPTSTRPPQPVQVVKRPGAPLASSILRARTIELDLCDLEPANNLPEETTRGSGDGVMPLIRRRRASSVAV